MNAGDDAESRPHLLVRMLRIFPIALFSRVSPVNQIVPSPRNCAVGITPHISGFLPILEESPTSVTLKSEPKSARGARQTHRSSRQSICTHPASPAHPRLRRFSPGLFTKGAPSLFADSSVWQANCVSTGSTVRQARERPKAKAVCAWNISCLLGPGSKIGRHRLSCVWRVCSTTPA